MGLAVAHEQFKMSRVCANRPAGTWIPSMTPFMKACSAWWGNAGSASSSKIWSSPIADTTLDEGYRAMAADKARETEAMQWSNALAVDVSDEVR